MKTLFLFIAACSLTAQAQVYSYRVPGSYATFTPGPGFDLIGRGAQAPENTPRAKDPLRMVDGELWNVSIPQFTNGWVQFMGKVAQVQPNGVRIQGTFTGMNNSDSYADFFVENFPYEVAEGERVEMDQKTKTFFCAKLAGVYTYHTVMGSSRTIKKLDYGAIYIPPPPTAEQLAAYKAAEEKRKKDAVAKTVKWVRDQADAGDAFNQLRMGERYLKGEGVDKDEAKAREYLTKASAQGNTDARELRAKLDKKE